MSYSLAYHPYNTNLFLNRDGNNTVDPDAQAFLTAAEITNVTEVDAINNLVVGLKSDGLWSKMKAVYPFVTDNRNLYSYTEDFTNSYWFKTYVNLTANAITAPDGTLTAEAMFETAALNQIHGIQKGFSLTSVTAYTYSVHVKQLNGREGVVIRFGSASTDSPNGTFLGSSVFLFDTETFTGDYIKSFENLGNGWYRLMVTMTPPNALLNVSLWTYNGTSANFTGDVTKGVYVWGSQFESGSSATPYQQIATTQQAFIANQFKFNLVNPVDSDAAFRLVFNGGWTHSSTGATPNGTNGYADTKFIANTYLTKGDGHLSYYSRTNSANSSSSTTMGDNLLGRARIVLRRLGDIAYMECGTDNADSRTYTVTDSRCFAVANVILNQNVDFFRNGIKETATAINSSNQGWSTGAIGIGGSSSSAQYDNKQAAFASIGDGFTDTEAANLYTRVQAYQTALNRQV